MTRKLNVLLEDLDFLLHEEPRASAVARALIAIGRSRLNESEELEAVLWLYSRIHGWKSHPGLRVLAGYLGAANARGVAPPEPIKSSPQVEEAMRAMSTTTDKRERQKILKRALEDMGIIPKD